MRTRLIPAFGVLITALVLASASAQQGRAPAAPPQAPFGNIPPIWNVKFTLHDQARRQDRGGALSLRTTDFTGMEYEVQALPDMRVDPSGTLRGEFKMILDSQSPGSHADQVWQGPQSSRKALPKPAWRGGQTELLLGRRIEVKNCEKLLDVHTTGSRNMPSNGKPNTFVISSNLEWSPTHWKSTIYVPRPPVTVTVPSWDDGGPVLTLPELEVSYDFQKLVNDNDGKAYTLPSYSFGGFRTVKRTINYTITRKPMTLEYVLPAPDLLRGKGLNCENCTSQTANYGTAEESVFVAEQNRSVVSKLRYLHSNVEIRLLIDGDDVQLPTTDPGSRLYPFDILRLRRDWASGVGPGYRGLDAYQRDTGHTSAVPLVNGWIMDKSFKGNFRDTPGLRMYNPPSEWKNERQIQEFLVGVQGFPEFGFLYYAVAIETRPGEYRVSQLPAKHLTASDWCARIRQQATGPLEMPQFTRWVPVDEW